MKLSKFLAWCGKAIISGMIALACLTAFCYFYYNVPVHYDNPDGSTDYVWEKNKFYSRATEGLAMGKTNNEGRINTFDYNDGVPISVLIMGSSHMEAYNVGMTESTSSRLNELLVDDTVYNIGTSAHNFLVCADNLDAALDKYKPTEFVVIEAFKLDYSDEQLQSVIDGNVPDQPSHAGRLIELLQKNPFLRLTASQIDSFLDNNQEADTESTVTDNSLSIASDEKYDAVLKKIAQTAEEHGTKLIIVHHSNLYLNEDGSVSCSTDEAIRDTFSSLCQKNGIYFIDMTDRFIQEYNENYVLPHGFSNTSAGNGHLNKYGHAMIADALYDLICEVR